MKFAMDFFQQEKVRCAPGAGYGAAGEGHVRFALVASMKDLEETCTRLERVVKNLPPTPVSTLEAARRSGRLDDLTAQVVAGTLDPYVAAEEILKAL